MSAVVDLVVVLCPRALDRVMHDAGVFEQSKRLVETAENGLPRCRRFTLTVDHDVPDNVALVDTLRQALDKNTDVRALAVFAPGQPGGWRDPSCTHVSTGRRSMALTSVLEQWGYVSLGEVATVDEEVARVG